jgi:release factor glutamine methyltransferase
MPHAEKTIREAFLKASSFLKERGVKDAAICTELLLQHLFGWDRTTLLLRWGEVFPASYENQWEELVNRKAGGEPVQYILGEQDFYGLPFEVNKAVLIPRPETELLVERIIYEGKRLFPQGSPLLADIGTGSGAIPVTLAHACPEWRVYSSDLSPLALEVARRNAVRNGVGDRVTLLQGDLLLPYVERGLPVDILVSNPPYIPTGDLPALQPEVRQFEPHTALFGGPDGLELYRRMMDQLGSLPKQPALVGLEVGIGQADAVANLLRGAGDWSSVEFVKDLAGIDRHVIALSAI